VEDGGRASMSRPRRNDIVGHLSCSAQAR
jgi:hypothetical protein